MAITAPSHTSLTSHYAKIGVVKVPGLLKSDEVDLIRDAFMDQVERDNTVGHDDGVPDGDVLSRYPRFVHPHRHPELEVGKLARRYMLDRRILDTVEAMVGPVNGAQSMFYFKPPTARGQALHQDNLFLQCHPETCVAVWIAIDRTDAENGGLRVVPGSHSYKLVCPGEADSEESFSRQEIHLPEGMSAEQTELEAGDALVFHGSMVHGSGANTSSTRFRRSLIFHYIPQASTKIAGFYLPLLSPIGKEIHISESLNGGACGDGWVPTGPH